ncbi:MAG: 30S ribosomal protein S2 [Candidatus Staskawiczbacteria bacterium]|nr:30S ribosomal protein S2 [Candidatus Staskawiczbacteria bacterium]MBI3337501.1 30S ribosomal protein S2 [Candidatus Staskawiczbacteria bacterium]
MTEATKKSAIEETKINIEEMLSSGLGVGHTVSRLHPKMKDYVSGIKNNTNIIDLDKTAKNFSAALKFISNLVSDNKKIIFVGTKIQTKDLVKKAAEDCSVPYVSERWLGGTFTNFETISKRVEYFKEMESKRASGEFEKYTKKERLKIDKELESLRIKFEGIKNMSKLPEAVFISDFKKDIICALEAKRKGIFIVAITDTNVDPTMADYPIPANDDAISSVKYILDKVSQTIRNSHNI